MFCYLCRAFSRVCLSVCPSSKRKMAWAISTKVGRHIVQGRTTGPEVKRLNVKSWPWASVWDLTFAMGMGHDAGAGWRECASHTTAHLTSLLPTPAQPPAWVGRSDASVCLSVCPRSKRKTAWAINTKLGTRILYSSHSACIDPEVKRSKVSHMVRKPSRRTVASDYRWHPVTLCCATCSRCHRGSACRYDCLCFLVVLFYTV